MRVLLACEESQRVCIAFRELGHEAYSCDILECSGGHPEWHIMSDCLPILRGRTSFKTMDGRNHIIATKWYLIIAFPPCTKTSNAGARHLWRGHELNIPRFYEGLCGKALFLAIWHANCDRVVIENPIPSAIFDFPQHSQVIQPFYFGDKWSKKTYLWFRGVCPLQYTDVVNPEQNCHDAGTWFMAGGKERQKNRAKTSPGIAKAMAEQWGGDIRGGLTDVNSD